MGQSITTPLSLTLDHWQDVRNRADNLSVEVKKKKWITLCTTEWPSYDIGWPKEGTFNLDYILQVKSRVFIQGPQGHPDQVPYIVTWENLASDPPSWVAPFSHSKLPPCSLSGGSAPPTLPPETPPLPSAPLIPVPTSPPKTSRLYPILDKSEKSAPTGTKQKKVLPPEDAVLIDLMTGEPPPYHPQPLPAPDLNQASSGEDNKGDQEDSAPRNPPEPSPMVGRLRGRREPHALGNTSSAFPLWQTGSPNGQYQYWPFSASDLYNWKSHNPSFSSDPVALTSLIESILVTHQPTWDDCQQLLQTLLTSEEK
ncbi:Hypothetical predicted protein [Marmota monax]|uniref:Uncharacterized protein n=1 Tax=Marmota monax TaxID=9995 RepID=A0A5E4AGN9_MARMO|nr:hypothetical protein GHT09_000222 [Marmota monax]VTJ55911.1 Hypothetical predicted protein [Marmota monax]